MKVLSHRGYWKAVREKNSITAFARSLELEFGLETDIRDCAGQLVISHDLPLGDEARLDPIIRMFHNREVPLALNIKADGLAIPLKNALGRCNVRDWFAFDMSIPDMRNYLNEQLPVFVRASDVEQDPPWLEEAAGIWFDSFGADNYDTRRIAEFLGNGRRVCVVSPELHNWPHEPLWMKLKSLARHPALLLCTDYPEDARRFFHAEQP